MVRYVQEFHDAAAARGLAAAIERTISRPVNLMEVCGTHTASVFRHGIRGLLPPPVNLLSGPGCPVCVTTNADIDKAIALAEQPGVTLATFGDMMKVPGSYQSLQQAKADGSDVRVVYSSRDAVCMARDNPRRPVVFLAVGFETTVPTIAASLLEAEGLGLKNFFVLSVHKLIPPAMRALLEAGEVRIDGFICPGHVSVTTGSAAFEPLGSTYSRRWLSKTASPIESRCSPISHASDAAMYLAYSSLLILPDAKRIEALASSRRFAVKFVWASKSLM